MSRDPLRYLDDLRVACGSIRDYTDGLDYESFIESEMTKHAVLFNLLVLGEAARSLPDELRNKYPEVPWRNIGSVRNRIAHGYFTVDFRVIWDIVENDIPFLLETLGESGA